MFVPFPAGGGVDTMVRGIIAQVAPRLPGARFVVTNRPGAGGQLGFEANFNAAPDGYTLGAATNTAMNAISVERTPRYRPAEFTYIANVVDDPAAFWVHPDSPWKNLADLAAAAKAQPETFGVGTAGVGSDDHILQLTFEEASGTRLIHIPYNGTGPTLRDLLGGRLPIGSFNMGEGLTLLREGKIRCLGQAGPQAVGGSGGYPDLPRAGLRHPGRQRPRHRRPARHPGTDPRRAARGLPRRAGRSRLRRRGGQAEPAAAPADRRRLRGDDGGRPRLARRLWGAAALEGLAQIAGRHSARTGESALNTKRYSECRVHF